MGLLARDHRERGRRGKRDDASNDLPLREEFMRSIGVGLSSRKGDRNTYFDGLEMVAEKIKKIDVLNPILHTDQGTVCASKGFNELFSNIIHTFDIACGTADGQRRYGGHKRVVEGRC